MNSPKIMKQTAAVYYGRLFVQGIETPGLKQLTGWDLSLPRPLASGVPASKFEQGWLRVPSIGLNTTYCTVTI